MAPTAQSQPRRPTENPEEPKSQTTSPSSASTCPPAPPARSRLTARHAWMTRPLRSARITRHHRYYEPVRPCAPHRYSAPRSSRCLGSSLSRPRGQIQPLERPPYRGDRFPRSIPEPELSSRRLHAGHHLGSKQVSPRLIPGQVIIPRFRCHLYTFDTSSAVRFRSPSQLIPDALPARLFRNAHHPGS